MILNIDLMISAVPALLEMIIKRLLEGADQYSVVYYTSIFFLLSLIIIQILSFIVI